jgi:dipeptidyl aminopeptidase/acylaminoacyl peptidase
MEVTQARMGSQALEDERLKANSPVNLAAQFRIPVLLVHGTQDRTVRFEQSQGMDEALTAAGKPHRFIRQDQGDHALSVYQHRLQFFTELDKFLSEHIGDGQTAAQAKP